MPAHEVEITHFTGHARLHGTPKVQAQRLSLVLESKPVGLAGLDLGVFVGQQLQALEEECGLLEGAALGGCDSARHDDDAIRVCSRPLPDIAQLPLLGALGLSWGLWQGVLTGWLGIGSLVHHGGLAQRFGQVLPVPHIGLQVKYLGGVVTHHADPSRVAASSHQLCKGWKAARAHQSCSRPRESLQPYGFQHLKA